MNITIMPADGNYNKKVIKEVVFKIIGSKPEEQPATEVTETNTVSADMTVTDVQGNPVGYTAGTVLFEEKTGGDETAEGTEGAQEQTKVYRITADPVKDVDGKTVTDTEGRPVYKQRNLHITAALVEKVKAEGSSLLQFNVGGASVMVDLAAWEPQAACTLRLAPLQEKDLTEKETAALAAYNLSDTVYAVRLVRDEDGEDVTEQAGGLKAMLAAPGTEGDEPAGTGIFFLKEDRWAEDPAPEVSVESGEKTATETESFLTRGIPGSGLFGAV